MNKWLKIGILAVLILGSLLVVIRVVFPGNVCETAPDHPESVLRTRMYSTDLRTFAELTAQIIPTLTKYGGNWKLVSAEVTDGSAVIKAEVPVVIFTDDLVVKAESDPLTGGTIVNIRSASRVGKSDLGENRRHVLNLLVALDNNFK